MSSIFRYSQNHPLRIPSWRWERARLVNEYGSSVPGKVNDDRYVASAARFRKLKDKCTDEIEQYRVYEQFPILSMAYELWDEPTTAKGVNVNPTRHEVEARILAGETFGDISARCGISAEVLEWYELLFFNVLDRLTNRTYILNQVIGDALQRGMTDKDYAIMWKLYAYVRGPDVLDYLIETFKDWTRPEKADIEACLMKDHRSTMRRKAALASRMYGLNSFTSDRMIELETKIVEVEKVAARAEDPLSAISTEKMQTNIQVMLNHLPLLVGHHALEQVKKTAIAKQYEMPADLRASEMMALAAGQLVDLDAIEQFKFPEPINPVTTSNGTKTS